MEQPKQRAGGEEAANSLAELYDAGSRMAEAAASSRDATKITAALDALSAAEAAVDRAALFSSNEDADDVPTSSIKYLLLPSMRAELLAGAPTTAGPQQRAVAVAAALDALTGFLRRTAQLGILKGPAAAAAGLGDDSDDGEGDRGSGDEGSGGGGRAAGRRALVAAGPTSSAAMDPGARRAAKIERFKRSRALSAAVEQLSRQRAAATARSGGDDEASDAGPTGGPGGWDEEDERRLWLLRVEGAALAGLDTRESLLQEMQLLRHMAAAAAGSGDHRSESGRGASTSSEDRDTRMRQRQRQDLPVGDAASRAAMMARLSGIAEALTINDKDRLRQQVFRPYVPLPTITVEQQGAIELAEAREREARAAEAERKKKARAVERRSDDEDDEEVAKARAWDDFKDDNPAGWGNSKLRPCA